MIDLPAHIDKSGWTIDDAHNKVIFIFHWQGVQRTIEKSIEMAQEIVDALNNRDAIAKMVEAIPAGQPVVDNGGNGGKVSHKLDANFKLPKNVWYKNENRTI